MNGKYKVGDVVLDNWTLVRLLGEGAYGRVYEAHREDFGTTYTAAIKIMTIPSSQSEVESVRAEGMDEAAVMAYFRGMAEDVVREFVLMSELKGSTNIVSCEDHAVVPHTEGVGWDIFIRMELLTPMLRYMSGHEMTRSDIIKLGVDMCRALELCQRYNIIHRDIKPENIFVSRAGDYKLGDFGVARTLEKTTGGLSKKGTYTYMAPEIYRDEPYGSTVDIYSLGIVLYRLLNNNRPPFLPPPPQPVSYSEREQALLRRVGGEQIPPPANAEGRLAEIVLKACAYEAKERYTSPLLMRRELEAIQYPRGKDELIYGRDEKIRVERSAFTGQGKTDAEATIYTPRGKNSPPEAPKKKKKTGLIAGVAAALVLAAAALALLPKLRRAETDAAPAAETPAPAAQTAAPAGETPIPVEETHAPAEEPAEPTPEPAPEPEEAAWVEGEWDWSLNGSTLTISGTGNMANYSETSPAPWASKVSSIRSIVIREGITGIGDYAFSGISTVHAVTVSIPEGVTVIGDHAFFNCRYVTQLNLPSSLRVIKDYAFCQCGNFYSLTIPEGVVSIGASAFCYSGQFQRVTVPASVEEIGLDALRGLATRIEVADGNPNYKSVDGVLFSKDGGKLLYYPEWRTTAPYTVPDGVVEICERAFAESHVSRVTIPESVVSIAPRAFAGCGSLTAAAIPASISEIGESAFSGCNRLQTLTISDGVAAIGPSAFSGCGNLKTVTIPGSVASVSDSAFASCVNLTAATIGEGVGSIGPNAFSHCIRMTSVTIPASVTEIGRAAFNGCDKLKSADYGGTQEQWAAIVIGEKNEPLTCAALRFGAA